MNENSNRQFLATQLIDNINLINKLYTGSKTPIGNLTFNIQIQHPITEFLTECYKLEKQRDWQLTQCLLVASIREYHLYGKDLELLAKGLKQRLQEYVDGDKNYLLTIKEHGKRRDSNKTVRKSNIKTRKGQR